MSSVGNELVEDAARAPIVDVVDGHDLVTNTAVLQVLSLFWFPNILVSVFPPL